MAQSVSRLGKFKLAHCPCPIYGIRSGRGCPIPARALVRVGVAGLDRNTRPPPSADTSYRFDSLRHGD
jgi:hypothetical protein